MTKKYFLSRLTCPACNSSAVHEKYRVPYLSSEIRSYLYNFYTSQGSIDFSYLEDVAYVLCECNTCKLIYQKYIPNNELSNLIYESWISPEVIKEQRKLFPISYYKNQADEIFQLAAIFNKSPANLKFFDFGMGWGAWALLVKGLGINSYGSELSNIQVENAKLNGIITLNWEEIPLFGFDFINAEQVFEHLNNPIETLIHLSSGLLKGGIIKISVPYASDLDRRLELMDWSAVKWSDNSLNIVSPLEHINCFRKETLYKMAELANLQVVFQRENENYILLKK